MYIHFYGSSKFMKVRKDFWCFAVSSCLLASQFPDCWTFTLSSSLLVWSNVHRQMRWSTVQQCVTCLSLIVTYALSVSWTELRYVRKFKIKSRVLTKLQRVLVSRQNYVHCVWMIGIKIKFIYWNVFIQQTSYLHQYKRKLSKYWFPTAANLSMFYCGNFCFYNIQTILYLRPRILKHLRCYHCHVIPYEALQLWLSLFVTL
jgi:hypothetical protein